MRMIHYVVEAIGHNGESRSFEGDLDFSSLLGCYIDVCNLVLKDDSIHRVISVKLIYPDIDNIPWEDL